MPSQPTEPSAPITDPTSRSSDIAPPAWQSSYPDATAAPFQDERGSDAPPATPEAVAPVAGPTLAVGSPMAPYGVGGPAPDVGSPQVQQPTYPWGGSPVAGQPPLGLPPSYGQQPFSGQQPDGQAPYAAQGGVSPMKAAAKRMMLFGVAWFVAGIIVSIVTVAVTSGSGSGGVIFWGLSLYGVIMIVRGAIAYNKA